MLYRFGRQAGDQRRRPRPLPHDTIGGRWNPRLRLLTDIALRHRTDERGGLAKIERLAAGSWFRRFWVGSFGLLLLAGSCSCLMVCACTHCFIIVVWSAQLSSRAIIQNGQITKPCSPNLVVTVSRGISRSSRVALRVDEQREARGSYACLNTRFLIFLRARHQVLDDVKVDDVRRSNCIETKGKVFHLTLLKEEQFTPLFTVSPRDLPREVRSLHQVCLDDAAEAPLACLSRSVGWPARSFCGARRALWALTLLSFLVSSAGIADQIGCWGFFHAAAPPHPRSFRR